MSNLIEQRRDGRILLSTLNRPEAANGIDSAMAEALEALADEVQRDGTQIDAVVLTGKGRVFCSGGDVGAFKQALSSADGPEGLSALLNELATRVHSAIERLAQAGPLLIAAVNGPATGAGLGLLCACDLAYANTKATLRAGFSRLGLSPDTGTTYFLPRIVGYRKALELLLRSDAVSAQAALELGIFSEIIDATDEAFIDQVLERTRALIACGPAVQPTRRLLRQSATAALQAQLLSEQHSLVQLATTPEVTAHLRKALGLG
ncbi:enoyl-CoA hydratase/isomerase family protein [Hydrocarboniphaga effusa]|uniref:enoyl-CoA hydratase/isomerase family protein n=1 Tax=Hydrocarboniphaga effusa TaxID=243629 RepID=UPI003BAB637B